MHKKVDKFVQLKSCLGCGLCLKKESDYGMIMGNNGYLRPSPNAIIDENFEKYCPAIKISQSKKKHGLEYIYGPVVAPVVAGWSTNKELRFKASSGGVITQLLIALLRYGMIDAVLHVRQDDNNPIRSIACLSKTEEDIAEATGSRYAPCSLFENFAQILSLNIRIAVVGKPCDIAALKQYMKLYPNETKNIKYTFSMMCMGLPSHNATIELVKKMNVEPSMVANLRYRGYGWPGYATVTDMNGKVNKCTYIQSWGAVLGRHTLFRCKLCPNGFGEFADITCGDAWHCYKGEPSFNNAESGRSFIFIRSEKGKHLVDRAIKEGLLKVEPYDLNKLPLIQKSQYQRKVNLLGRYIIFKLFVNHYFSIKGFNLFKLAYISGFMNLCKDSRGFLGRYWRDYKEHKK